MVSKGTKMKVHNNMKKKTKYAELIAIFNVPGIAGILKI